MSHKRLLFFVSVFVISALVTFVPSSAMPSLAQAQPALKPVIIDTDMAVEDWIAIMYLVQRADMDVLAVTVSGNGEAHCSPGVFNTMSLLATAGSPDIPVACGRETPLQGNNAFPRAWRAWVDGMLGVTLTVNPNPVGTLTAVELLLETIQASEQPVTLVSLGTLTNYAELLQASPEIVNQIAMIYVMGGALEVPGNLQDGMVTDNAHAEWNLYADPLAAAQVIESGVPITLVPLDATNQVPMTMAFYDNLSADHTTPEAVFVYEAMSGLSGNLGGWYFWDTLTNMIASDEQIATYAEQTIRVITAEGAENGRVVVDETGSPVRVAVTVEVSQFEQILLDVLNGRDPAN